MLFQILVSLIKLSSLSFFLLFFQNCVALYAPADVSRKGIKENEKIWWLLSRYWMTQLSDSENGRFETHDCACHYQFSNENPLLQIFNSLSCTYYCGFGTKWKTINPRKFNSWILEPPKSWHKSPSLLKKTQQL